MKFDPLAEFWKDNFSLRRHLGTYLSVEPDCLELRLSDAQRSLKDLGETSFTWETSQEFYSETIRDEYLYELSAWHETSSDYIGNTLKLVRDCATELVLDFGGGIGTHTIAAAQLPHVRRVDYVDINPINRAFVAHRSRELCLSNIDIGDTPKDEKYSTILCLDVFEHLFDPIAQLRRIFDILSTDGILICNWYFFKGFDGEFPFHLDDRDLVRSFLLSLQLNFLEEFHPYTITTRCYRPHPQRIINGELHWLDP
ncbi:MAG: class I SAM-dependent methyltransferase [Kovacikia sp.]